MKNDFPNKTSLTKTERTQRGRAYLCLDQQQPFGEMMTAQASQDPNSLSNFYNHHFHDP